tara:strand:+ start:61 stop:312 length:252 start_codon:yes stop_codon:yes gene_type:complete
MNNVKLASCTTVKGVASNTVGQNEHRRKLIITNPNASEGTFTLGGTDGTLSGNIAISAHETIILDEYKGEAGTSTNVKLVELI